MKKNIIKYSVYKNVYWLTEPVFDYIGTFSEGVAPVRHGSCWGYINTDGDMVIEPRYDAAAEFSEGMALVMVQEKWGYIGHNGKIRIKPEFDYPCGSFHEGLASVARHHPEDLKLIENGSGSRLRSIYGYINRKGELVIPVQYEQADDFSEGLAAVKINGRYGYINRQGRIVIKPVFDMAESFQNYRAIVVKEGMTGIIEHPFFTGGMNDV